MNRSPLFVTGEELIGNNFFVNHRSKLLGRCFYCCNRGVDIIAFITWFTNQRYATPHVCVDQKGGSNRIPHQRVAHSSGIFARRHWTRVFDTGCASSSGARMMSTVGTTGVALESMELPQSWEIFWSMVIQIPYGNSACGHRWMFDLVATTQKCFGVTFVDATWRRYVRQHIDCCGKYVLSC